MARSPFQNNQKRDKGLGEGLANWSIRKAFERGRIKPFPTGEKKKILKPEVKPE